MIINPPSLVDPFDHVYSRDPALEYEREGFANALRLFRETGDISHLEPFIREGQEPALWTLKKLRGKSKFAYEEALQISGGPRQKPDGTMMIPPMPIFVAAGLGLRKVRGFLVDGEPLEIKRAKDRDAGNCKVVVDEHMELLAEVDHGGLLFELGFAAIVGAGIPGK